MERHVVAQHGYVGIVGQHDPPLVLGHAEYFGARLELHIERLFAPAPRYVAAAPQLHVGRGQIVENSVAVDPDGGGFPVGFRRYVGIYGGTARRGADIHDGQTREIDELHGIFALVPVGSGGNIPERLRVIVRRHAALLTLAADRHIALGDERGHQTTRVDQFGLQLGRTGRECSRDGIVIAKDILIELGIVAFEESDGGYTRLLLGVLYAERLGIVRPLIGYNTQAYVDTIGFAVAAIGDPSLVAAIADRRSLRHVYLGHRRFR